MVFSMISIAICNVLFYDNSLLSVVEDGWIVVKGTVRNQFYASSLWFITCLAVVKIIFFWIKKLNKKSLILIAGVGLYLVATIIFPKLSIEIPSLPYNVDSAFLYMIYFAIGYLTYPLVENLLNPRTKQHGILLLGMSMFSLYFSIRLYFDFDVLGFLNNNQFLAMIYNIVRPLIIIWFYVIVAYVFRDSNLLCNVGKSTLYLCGCEYIARIIFERFENMIGISMTLENPLDAVIYTVMLLVFAWKILVPIGKYICGAIKNIYYV